MLETDLKKNYSKRYFKENEIQLRKKKPRD